MEDKKNNPAVKDELTNNNFEDMNKIDFSKVDRYDGTIYLAYIDE